MRRGRREVLLGRSRERTLGTLGVAAGLFAATFLLHADPTIEFFSSRGIPTGFGINGGVVIAMTLLPAAVNGYDDGGVLPSVALATGPVLGVQVPRVLYDPFFVAPTAEVVGFTLFLAVVVGLVGYAVGAGTRLLRGRFATR